MPAGSPQSIFLNRKDREEREEDSIVRGTQMIHCDVFAFLAFLAVSSGIRFYEQHSLRSFDFAPGALRSG